MSLFNDVESDDVKIEESENSATFTCEVETQAISYSILSLISIHIIVP